MGFGTGIGTGFFTKLGNIQDENRKAENEYMLEDLKQFNEGLKIYRANKTAQQEQDNKARGFALQISGDPRDTRALDVARTFVQGGHNLTDPIVLAQAQQMYGGMKLKEIDSQVQAQQSALPQADVTGQPQAPQAPGMGLGKGLFKQNMGASNVILGKSTPEQLQQKSLKNIAGRTGFSQEQVQNIRTGVDTGKSDFNPSSVGAPMDAGKSVLMNTAVKLAADPKQLTDPPKFWQAIGAGNYEEAGKYIANADQQNAWHIKASEIAAQATRDSANIHASATLSAASMNVEAARINRQATIENSPQYRYEQAAKLFGQAKQNLTPDKISAYEKVYPGINTKDPSVLEWMAIQEMEKSNPGSSEILENGPMGTKRQGTMEQLMPGKFGSTPPGYKSGATPGKNEPPKPTTDPTIIPQPKMSEKDEAKAVADRINAISDPTKREKLKKEYLQKYPKYYKENFLSGDKDPAKEKEQQEKNSKAMGNVKMPRSSGATE